MISWVMATRNDGYGGKDADGRDYTMRRLAITAESIARLPGENEIIVVEWNPPTDRKPVRAFLSGATVRVITVSPRLQVALDADNSGKPLPFYEYVAKHVGIGLAKGDRIIMCNPDNVFPVRGYGAVLAAFAAGSIVRADRLAIARSYASIDLPDLFALGERGDLTVSRTFTGATGDFCGFTRTQYNAVGGFAHRHGNVGLDNDFLRRLVAAGYGAEQTYEHYHIDHQFAGCEAGGRSKVFAEHLPITDSVYKASVSFVANDEER